MYQVLFFYYFTDEELEAQRGLHHLTDVTQLTDGGARLNWAVWLQDVRTEPPHYLLLLWDNQDPFLPYVRDGDLQVPHGSRPF